MADDKFAEKVVPSLENSKDRLYKNLKIKLITENIILKLIKYKCDIYHIYIFVVYI